MSDPRNYTVGWICAIETEYTAAQTFLDNEHEPPDRLSTRDTNHYTLGDVVGHNVVMAVLPNGEYGTSSAANVVTNMLTSFPNIAIGLLVGIGGGAPTRKDHIRLGDIVVSSPRDGSPGVYQYDYGKTIQGSAFVQTGFLNQPSTAVRSAVIGLKSKYRRRGHRIEETIESILETWPRLQKDFSRPPPESDRLYASSFVHSSSRACDESCALRPDKIVKRQPRQANHDNPYVHYGIIASGNQLMKDALIRDRYAKDQDVLCFEMEAAGIMNHFPCLVIRGICDYSDSHKNKRWQGYAAMAAAAYAKDLLGEIHKTMPQYPRSTSGLDRIRCGVSEPYTNVSESGITRSMPAPEPYIIASRSRKDESMSKHFSNSAPPRGSQSSAAGGLSRNPSLESMSEDTASTCNSHTSLENDSFDKLRPQWTIAGWFDESREIQGFCPAFRIHDIDTLTRMISADEEIEFDVMNVTVQSRSEPFAHSDDREAFYARTEAAESQFVLKSCINGSDEDCAKMMEGMRIQTLCKAFALEFNGLLEINPPLDFVSKTVSGCISLEQFLEGEFVEYNSYVSLMNDKLSDDPFNQVAQAFSHFTFERSRGLLLVNNLEGVNHLLTHPAIQTSDSERFRLFDTNLNVSGFKFFFARHECNINCRKLGLKSNRETFISGNVEYRREWPKMIPTVCCSNKLCRGIMRMANSYKSIEFPGHYWCRKCWELLNKPTTWRICIEHGPKHEFEVSRFFYESQGQLPPSKCPDHRRKDTPQSSTPTTDLSIPKMTNAVSSRDSVNSNIRTYDNDRGRSGSGSGRLRSGVTIAPPPAAPRLQSVPQRARHWFSRGDSGEKKKAEHYRSRRKHEEEMVPYYRKHG